MGYPNTDPGVDEQQLGGDLIGGQAQQPDQRAAVDADLPGVLGGLLRGGVGVAFGHGVGLEVDQVGGGGPARGVAGDDDAVEGALEHLVAVDDGEAALAPGLVFVFVLP